MTVENKKKVLWKDVGNKANENLEGGMRQMWVGMKAILGEQAERQPREYLP